MTVYCRGAASHQLGVGEGRQRFRIELGEIEKQIEISDRMLDHEFEMLPVDTIPCLDEAELMAEVDRYLESPIGSSESEAVKLTASEDEVERVIE